MTTFIILCVAMVAMALALIVRPLIKAKAATTLVTAALLVIAVSAAVYLRVGHRTWEHDQQAVRSQATTSQDLAANITRLEQHLREQPNDVDAAMNLAEVLLQQDERSITGRAGELVELVLTRVPDNPKALWYGAITALSTGRLPVARERLQRILTQNPPENIRSIIERQIQDIGQQLGEAQAQVANGRALNIQVSAKAGLLEGVDKSTTLFVLVRDPEKGGPPLAVARRTVGDLPLSVTLTDNDAMMPGHGISSVTRVQIVARVSQSGSPQAQPGDIFGETTLDIKESKAFAVKIAIDRKVDK